MGRIMGRRVATVGWVVGALLCLFPVVAQGQQDRAGAASSGNSASASQISTHAPPGAASRAGVSGAVAGVTLPASGQERIRKLSVEVSPRMRRYSTIRYVLSLVSVLVQLGVLGLILTRGWSVRLREFAEKHARPLFGQVLLFYPAHTLLVLVLMLPFAAYSSFLMPHEYGLSTHTFPGWLLDRAKGFGVQVLIGTPVLTLLVWLLRRQPVRWWVWCWLGLIPLSAISVLLAPVLLDPLYNRFTPLPEGPLRQRILGLAARAGIREGRVFEVDASRRTRSVNAYVTGLGGTTRIVLWDTLLEHLDEEEALAVMAHEMGHYVERHVLIGLAAGVAGSLLLLFVLDRLVRWVLVRQGARWGIRGPDDLAALPLYLALVAGLNFAASPATCAVSRTIEARADAFALRLVADPRDVASALIRLSENNLSLPRPPKLVEFWFFSHPPLQDRIDRALEEYARRNQTTSR